ncbi:MAG: DUF6338 family protein [Calditrichota bacterium]
MDSFSLTTVYIVLLLLPGFVSSLIARALAYRPDTTQFDKLISAFVYTFLIHSVYAVIFKSFTPWTIQIQNQAIDVTINNRIGLIIFFCIAIALGCLSGLLKNKDWHMKLARWLRITNRTSRQSLWMDVFLDKKNAWVSVHLQDGRSVIGWAEYFSDSYSSGPVVFLKNAQWQIEDGKYKDIPDPGILLNGEEIHSIQFYIRQENQDESDSKQ